MHTPDESRFDWYETVSSVYADVVADADPDEGIQREAAFDIASARIHDALERGDLKPPMDEVVKVALLRADESHGKRADRVIRDTVHGVVSLDLGDADPTMRTVVTLGGGLRKLWRDVTPLDLVAMDENRFRNIKQAQDAYNDWREHFEPARRAALAHGTIGAAVAAGAFGGAS